MPKKIVLSLTLFGLWFNQILLLAWLAEEEDDDENDRFYNQLNGEGRRIGDLILTVAIISHVEMKMNVSP
jgi:hypothetical protein